ncbi:hypothetical protein GGR52DRAFT_592186 [Hypoxylon sp. FL1284]|nr:hypothetical protein GGR52DRAFT_592186 [Hypoxylon sp. FL1284]
MPVTTLLCSIAFAWCVSALAGRLTTHQKSVVPWIRKRFSDVFGHETAPLGDHDEVYPVHFIDQAAVVRPSLISYSFRNEHVLDAQKLRDSLVMLLTSGNWRKLAGRLRQNKDGKLEIHVPQHFSSERPPIRFSHVKLGVDMRAHPQASRLPRKTGNEPSVHEGCHTFRKFSIPSTLPNNIKHYLSTDEPLICLHINSFTDGTVVSLTFPHSLSDAMGMSDLLRAWTRVLRDQSTKSLPLQLEGAREDITETVGSSDDKIAQNTKFVLEDQQTAGLSLVTFMARYAWDMLTRRNIEAHHIYLPANFISHLHKQAEKELSVKNADGSHSAPFVSDGDLITAWGSRMVLSSSLSSTSASSTAVICNVFDMRKRLGPLLKPSSSAAYLQNLILPSTTVLTAAETRGLGVSGLALRVRAALAEQTGEAQVRGLMRVARAWFSSLGTMPLFADRDTARVIACTNWTKARLPDRADFGPAIVTTKAKASSTASGDRTTRDRGEKGARPIAFWGTTLAVSDKPRDTFVVYGKDGDGDYWLHAYLRTETWRLIRKELDEFSSNWI